LTPVVEVGKGAKFASGEHRVEDSAGFPHIPLARSAGFEIADVAATCSPIGVARCSAVLASAGESNPARTRSPFRSSSATSPA